tara:strand:+ start:675 stop:860 length:186 start_codon:yes stop_codon:yes gene_type:complete
MAHMSAESYYELNFSLMQYHKYSLTEIENMMPFERDIYVALLKNYLESEKLKAQQEYGLGG